MGLSHRRPTLGDVPSSWLGGQPGPAQRGSAPDLAGKHVRLSLREAGCGLVAAKALDSSVDYSPIRRHQAILGNAAVSCRSTDRTNTAGGSRAAAAPYTWRARATLDGRRN